VKLRVDVRRFMASCETPAGETGCATEVVDAHDLDLRRLPWEDGAFAAIELDDVPDPSEWTHSGPAMNECRRVLKRNGLIEIRTRRLDAKQAQATEKATIGALTRLLQNHGFDVVSVDPVQDEGSLVAAMALRGDGPEDVFQDQVAGLSAHTTLHGPLLERGDDAASNRALAVSLDAQGVKVRVRVIFDVLDALYCE
jgi:hypothetical protein